MTYPDALAALDALYATLPAMACQGRCQAACGPVALTKLEVTRLRRTTTLPTRNVPTPPCPLLRQGRCSVYAVRPLICRAWGAVESMQCPHGCQPERLLTIAEWEAVTAAVDAVSRSLFPAAGLQTLHSGAAIRQAQEDAAEATAAQMWVERG